MERLPRRAGRRGRRCLLAAAVLFALLWPAIPRPALALDGQLNVNTATVEQLEQLPFIGAARARAIVELRRQGPLHDLTELEKSPAIGPSTFQAIRPYLKVDGPNTLAAGAANTGQATTNVAALVLTRPGEIQPLPDGRYYDTLKQLIASARQRIDIAMFLFKAGTNKGNLAHRLMEDLLAARQRGVRVTVVLEHSGYDAELDRENHHTAQILEEGGVTVAFDDAKTTTHAKLVVIDQHLCLVGSHNFTHSALRYNHEMSLLVDSRELAGQLLAYMETLPR